MNWPIKQKALDDHLPSNSGLRLYLSQKDETAKIVRPRFEPNLADYRTISNPKVILVLPPMCLSEGAVKRAVPPLGLCYIAASLRQRGFAVTILDCIAASIDETEQVAPGVWRFGMSEERFRDYLRTRDFDVVGFSMIYSSDLPNLYRYAVIVKELRPETIVVAGGLHATKTGCQQCDPAVGRPALLFRQDAQEGLADRGDTLPPKGASAAHGSQPGGSRPAD